MPTFAELLRKYIERSGITDAELARSIGVRRQTIFRWKEGIVARPRHRDDVINLSKRLRLTDEERDELLIVAGFAPESMPESYPVAADPGAAENNNSAGAERNAEEIVAAEEIKDAPVTVRIDDKQADDKKERDAKANDTTDNEASKVAVETANTEEPVVARPAWLKLLPIGIILLLVGGVGSWLLGGEKPTEPAVTTTVSMTSEAVVTPTRSGPPLPEIAAEDETLLLAALFQNYTGNQGYNVAGRLEKELAEQIDSAGLNADTRADILYREILNEDDANSALTEFGAALIVWGEYDSGRVVVNLTTRSGKGSNSRERYLPSVAELAPTININVPTEVRILALLALGEHLLAENEHIKAKAALEKARGLEPPEDMQTKLYFQLGRAYVAAGEYQQSIDAYTKVLTLSPSSVNTHYNLGLAYYERYTNRTGDPADLDRAIEEYDLTIKRKPGNIVNAYLNRGIAYYTRKGPGDLEAAEADLSLVVEEEPESYRAFYNRGLLDISLNNAELWESDLLRAKELAEPASNDYVNTLVALCWGYMLEKEFDDAKSSCGDALEIAPERGDSRDSMGIVYALDGDFDAAIEQFELYLAWLEEQPDAYYDRYNGPLVEEWIVQLEASEQPITDEVLEGLRG